MNVYLRTNYNAFYGMGNFRRIERFGNYLEKKKINITYILDQKGKFDPKNCIYLYQNKNKFISQENDASEVVKHIGIKKSLIIVDDPRFDAKWEKKVSKFAKKLIVFTDNLTKKHYCQILINTHSKFENKYIDFRQEYKNNHQNTKYLLGPKFFLKKKLTIKKGKKKFNPFKIGLYNGSSGNFQKFLNFIEFSAINNKNIIFNIIIGHNAKLNKKEKLIFKKYKNIKTYYKQNNPEEILLKSNLIILPESMAMMDLSYRNVPLIIFDFKNKYDPRIFESIGNYFYLNKFELNDYKKIFKLISTIKKNYSRVLKLGKVQTLDKLGYKRIYENIFKKYDSKENLKKNILSNKFEINQVKDNHINNYLFSRNLLINRSNSINKKKIQNLDHYIWWFNKKRNIFYAKKNGKILYYMYEDIKNFMKTNFIIPGYLNCDNNNINVFEVLQMLKWQKKHIDSLKLKGKKICLITVNAKNKFSNLQTKLFDFKNIKYCKDRIVLLFIKNLKINKNYNIYFREINENQF